tara:strand:+ start:146 stop:370 length:225 start_codon:yes stop_codon:yes gene_type:complete
MTKHKFATGDLVEYRGELGMIVAHKLYDAQRDGYLVRFNNASSLGTMMLLPSEIDIVYAAKKIENSIDISEVQW